MGGSMSSIVIFGDTSGSITLDTPAVAGTNTLTLPAATGTILTTASSINASSITSGTLPKQQLPAGSVLQVIQSVKTDTFATSPGAIWADVSGLSASITPTSATSKILISVDMKAAGQGGTSQVRSRLLRNSTAIYVGDAAGNRPQSMGQFYIGDRPDNIYYLAQIGGTFLDSPATTSSITYKMQIGADSNILVVYVNRTQDDRNTTYFDSRCVSSITLMEIAA
jgi:hypothetical protein